MATRVTTTLIDDLDQSEASETVTFALDGAAYEIDLSEKNAAKLRDDLAPWVKASRRTSGRRTTRTGNSDVDNKTVRRWAEANGIELSKRGRIPLEVVNQFRAAGN
jgi:nucleoid-associated protein Lsr2